MRTLRFYGSLTLHTLQELCQRRWLLAGLALLCLILPLCAGPAAQEALSGGVSFSGINLAVTALENDATPQLLAQAMNNMSDVQRYCSFEAMDGAEAAAALERGAVTAILALPEGFVEGVVYGRNPDVRLIVPGDRPLEALLTLWVGQSAADLLSSVQAGIYGVLALYEAAPPEGLTWEQAKLDINLCYVNWTLNRQNLFQLQTVSATQTLPVSLHYALSLLSYLGLAAAPLFSGVFGSRRLAFWRRLRCLGRSSLTGYWGDLSACTAVLFLLVLPPMLWLTRGPLLPSLAAALVFALFCAVFGSLCCLITTSAAACGGLTFTLALLALGAAGGILPPVLLPQTLRSVSWLSPVAWLRTLLALPAGYAAEGRSLAAMALTLAVSSLLAAALYHRRVMQEECL